MSPHNKKLSRRDFLKVSASLTAGLGLAACSSPPPAAPPASSTPIPSIPAAPTATNTNTATAAPAPTASSTPAPNEPPTPAPPSELRDYAQLLGLEIGVLLMPDVPNIAALQGKQFNHGAVSSAWAACERQSGEFRFGWPGQQAAYAQSNAMTTRLHHLFDGMDCPEWLTTGAYSPAEITGFLQRYTENTMRFFAENAPGVMTQYVVVNEFPYPADQHPDFLLRKLGEEYVLRCFEAARKSTENISPRPLLVYNHTQNHASQGAHGANIGITLKHTEMLKKEGLVDAVGCQMHIGAHWKLAEKSDIIQTFQNYQLPVLITEMDVSLAKFQGSADERLNYQADIYRTAIEAALESGVCRSITFWSYCDSPEGAWLEQPDFAGHPLGGPNSDPALWDATLQPKPAYYAVLETLRAAYEKKEP